MRKNKALLAISLVCAACAFAACVDRNGGASNETAYPERADLRAEVGYDYELPQWLTSRYSSFALTDENGTAIALRGVTAHFSKTGEYFLSCDDGKLILPVYAVDTEKPSLKSIEGTNWESSVVAEFSYGDPLDFDDLFVPVDNSGEATASFTVYEMGVKRVELQDGHLLKCDLKTKGYYSVETLVTDASGNSRKFTNRIESIRWFDPADGPVIKYTITEQWSWGGPITLAESDLADGTPVTVSLDLLTEGIDATTNQTFLLAYNDTGDKNKSFITQPAGWDKENSTDKYSDWDKVKFSTVVRNGKIEIQWSMMGPVSGQVTQGQTFYFRNVTVEKVEAEVTHTITKQYAWGYESDSYIHLADTDLANGTKVTVTLKLKTSGIDTTTNKTFLLAFLDEGNGSTSAFITQPGSSYDDWTEFTFQTVARNGKIEIRFGIQGPSSAAITPGQTFYFKDIVVTPATEDVVD